MTALPGIAPLAQAFRSGEDDPVKALARALAAANKGAPDRALLWRVPEALAEAERRELGTLLEKFDGLLAAARKVEALFGPRTSPRWHGAI